MKPAKLPTQNYVWTPGLAYIVGLLVTDGNLSKDGRHITMISSDKDLIETFRDCLSIKNSISTSTNNGYSKRPSYRMQFSNVKLYKWLLGVGLFPNKTHTIGEIDLPNEYFKDFLRGHLDGDGTILTYQDKYNHYRGRTYTNHRVYTKFISASEEHIRWLHKKIQKLFGIKGSLASCKPSEKNRAVMWTIKFAKRESLKLLPWLYYASDLPALKRKQILTQSILQTIPYEKRKQYSKVDQIN